MVSYRTATIILLSSAIMKITIKTTQQKVFQVFSSNNLNGSTLYSPQFTTKIDIEPSDSIAGLKSKIEDAQGHPVGVQKIIYAGMYTF